MDAFVKRCEHCKELVPETKRGRPQRFCSDRCRQAHRKINATAEGGLRYRTGRLKPKLASQDSELSRQSKPENPYQKTHLRFERVNEVTFKLTDGENTNVPASHGQWGGYRTTKAVACVINIASGQWLARCRDEASGPSSFNEAKTNALAMARGACGDYFIENPIDHLNGLQARLLDRDGGGGVMSHRNLLASKNLDVAQTSHDPVTQAAKGSAGDLTLEPLLSVVCPFPAQPNRQREHRGCYRPLGSKYISVPQATNHVEAVKFAKSIGVPLVAHLTIHWSGTDVWDDPDGTRFAKVREGLAKVLNRRGIPVAWVWCRECKKHTDIVHSHLLFHLPAKYRFGRKLDELTVALERLVARHGGGIWSEYAVKLKVWRDPDGLYLLKGGGPEVWRLFRIKKKWREAQGVIHGKRCGVSQNLGPAARLRALMHTETARSPVATLKTPSR